MVTNRSAPPGTIVPSLIYEDANEAISWLCDTFGFTEILRWGSDDAPTAQLAISGGAIFVTGPRVGHGSADRLAFRPPRPDELSHTVMVEVEDVDRHYERATERGARILLPIKTHPFGERQYSTLDLGGHLWTFTQSVADVAPEEWGGRLPTERA
ncbi:MAG: VOC family protein [Dehalococcoidia bacterium]